MKLEIAEDAEDLSRRAFALTERRLAGRKDPLVVLPTGNTPLGLYAEAARHGRKSALARARFVQLDEYLGIARDDRRTLSGWARRVLLDPLGIPEERLIAFDCASPKPAEEARRIEAVVRESGLALALLGLGPNGHLGFNEPRSAFDSQTRPIRLTPASIKSNAVYWGGEDQVPRRAYTLGLGTLARATASILLVSGRHKAGILRRVLEDVPSPKVPATFLRLQRNATVIADRAALEESPKALVAAFVRGRRG